MKIAIKLLLWVLVAGVALFPALLLILFVIGLSVVISGAMAVSAVGFVLGIIFVALVGLSIMIPSVLLIIRFMTFLTVNARFRHGNQRVVLPVSVRLTGRSIYHAIYENFKAGRRQGKHLVQAWSFGFETYFHEDLQAYLADQILAQHGPEMAEAFVLDERHSYTIAY